MYPNVSLFIDGAWMQAAARGSLPVVSPASGDTIGSVRMPTALISTVHWRPLLTMEQGKPLPEARGELLAAADVIDCFAEEARRTYGRVIPARTEGVYQLVVKEPVGPVAAFTPWNFPINQVVRKLSCALAAGCSIIVKAPE